MAAVVYMATHRESGKRYIGVTQRGFARRRKEHENAPNAKRVTCRHFHSAMAKYGPDAFDWQILATCGAFEEGLAKEVALIARMAPEYNLTDGGQGSKGHRMTPEGRARWREKMVGRKLSAEARAAISARQIGTKRTPDARAKMSAARIGMKFSDDHKRNLAAARTGKKESVETCEKKRQAMKDWRPTQAHVEKVRAALKGKPRPPEVIEKMRSGLLVYQEARRARLSQ